MLLGIWATSIYREINHFGFMQQFCYRQSISKADRTKCASLLRHCLLAADPQFLGRLGEVITKLAIGEVIVGLDTVIQTLLNFADDADSCSASAETTEWRDGEREQECGERSAKSASPEAMQSVKRTLRIEQAKRRLSTSKAKLQKQRTLERVRCLTGDESGEEKNEKELKGLEKDICRIIEGVLPWVREHAEIAADEAIMHELRDIILQRSCAICFPDGAASDLFEKQLSTIVDDTLSQYYGEKVGADREQLIFDISEVLYNELAFFQLMHNIDNMVEETPSHD
ncbi:unnamed protein product [Toxocara canis]|uniref:PCM1_C domain-containing protein n=1 Tax=Toxocara canis TaxID=6265 RepID=A0A183UA64_TOXCA|nr:unnamed protein product [Toxocara canis]